MNHIEVAIAREWLSVADICYCMDVSTFVVSGVLRSGRLPAVKFGREWRVARVDFEMSIEESRVRAVARCLQPPAQPATRRPPVH